MQIIITALVTDRNIVQYISDSLLVSYKMHFKNYKLENFSWPNLGTFCWPMHVECNVSVSVLIFISIFLCAYSQIC